jgi:hypothetical protein
MNPVKRPKSNLKQLIFILAGFVFGFIAFAVLIEFISSRDPKISAWFYLTYPSVLVILSATSFYCAFRKAK